jgi:FkbM family methyltransferase
MIFLSCPRLCRKAGLDLTPSRMPTFKRIFKRNSHNGLFKVLAGFGRALNRLYENRNHDFHSNGELTVLKRLAAFHPKILIDGGANIGGYSVEAARSLPGCSIHAFEPVPATYDLLQQRIQHLPQVRTWPVGLFSTPCAQEVNTFASHAHASLFDIQGLPYAPEGRQTIRLMRGDDFLDAEGIAAVDFLKLDLEGAEYEALLGFGKSLAEGRIKMVQFEYGYINISTKRLLIDYYQFFEAHGYVVGKIFPKVVEFRPYEFKYEDFLGPNYLAVKKTETALIASLAGQ